MYRPPPTTYTYLLKLTNFTKIYSSREKVLNRQIIPNNPLWKVNVLTKGALKGIYPQNRALMATIQKIINLSLKSEVETENLKKNRYQNHKNMKIHKTV